MRHLIPALRMTAVLTVLTGFAYPGLVTLLARVMFPGKANGSLIRVNGRVVGSKLIGQAFSRPEYFHGRPSAAGSGYDATNSGGSNLGPTNAKLIARIRSDREAFLKANPATGEKAFPADLLTASGSGLDPDISPASAELQVPRIAAVRHVQAEGVRRVVAAHIQGPQLGFVGEPRVNVLLLNLDLDRNFPLRR
jgi:K+-transporting ATPase ATPase C chain